MPRHRRIPDPRLGRAAPRPSLANNAVSSTLFCGVTTRKVSLFICTETARGALTWPPSISMPPS